MSILLLLGFVNLTMAVMPRCSAAFLAGTKKASVESMCGVIRGYCDPTISKGQVACCAQSSCDSCTPFTSCSATTSTASTSTTANVIGTPPTPTTTTTTTTTTTSKTMTPSTTVMTAPNRTSVITQGSTTSAKMLAVTPITTAMAMVATESTTISTNMKATSLRSSSDSSSTKSTSLQQQQQTTLSPTSSSSTSATTSISPVGADCSHANNCSGGGACVGEIGKIGVCQCSPGYMDDNRLGCIAKASSQTSKSTSNAALSMINIVIIAVAAIVVVIVVVIVAVLCIVRRKSDSSSSSSNDRNAMPMSSIPTDSPNTIDTRKQHLPESNSRYSNLPSRQSEYGILAVGPQQAASDYSTEHTATKSSTDYASAFPDEP